MKKELLLATTIAGLTMGATSASAVTGTMGGNNRVGLLDVDRNSSTATTGTTNSNIQSTFSVSLEETMDSGTKIATSFVLATEGTDGLNPSGLTLTFTDGSSLELVSAGNAYKDHEAAVPTASGEMSLGQESSNSAAIGIDGIGVNNAVGLAWHSAADVMGVEGLSVSLSYSNGDETTLTATTQSSAAADSSMSAGLTYVTTTGDTTVTIGAGMLEGSDNNSNTLTDYSMYTIGAVATNGNLTVGAGMADGEYPDTDKDLTNEVADWEAAELGVKYVSGDLTFVASHRSSEAVDGQDGSTPSGSADAHEQNAVSIDYAVASGVTTTIGMLNQTSKNEGVEDKTGSGSSWYIGTNLSF